MHETAQATGQAVADVAQGIGAAQLAKEHGDELRPASKALGGSFGPVFLHQRGEFRTGKMVEQLIEEARSLYDCLGPPCGRRSAKLRPRNDSPTFNYRRAPSSHRQNLFWTTVISARASSECSAQRNRDRMRAGAPIAEEPRHIRQTALQFTIEAALQ